MPTVTLTFDLSDELADKITALPEKKQAEIAADALQKAVDGLKPNRSNVKDYFAKRSPQNSAAALFAEWAEEDAASGITPEQAEAEWEELKANLNENRRLTGEESLF